MIKNFFSRTGIPIRVNSPQECPENVCVVFVSLGSPIFNESYFKALELAAINAGASGLLIVLLDELEVVNWRLLYGHDIQSQGDHIPRDYVAERCIRVEAAASVVSKVRLYFLRYSQWRERCSLLLKTLDHFKSIVLSERPLFSLITNETYRNLTPRLRRLGVQNRRHPLVEDLSQYLIDEIAAKLVLNRLCNISCEFAPKSDRELFRRVMANKEVAALTEMDAIFPLKIIDSCGGLGGLKVNGLEFSYQARSRGESFTLGPLNFSAAAGEILGVYGPSGCGKTTLLRLIAGHLKLSRGNVRVGMEDITSKTPGQRSVITVFQEMALFDHLTVAGNIAYGLRRAMKGSSKRTKDLTDIYMRRFEIDQFSKKKPRDISGGERQRTAIARSLIVEPSVLLFDEPTSNLDRGRIETLALWLQSIVQGQNTPTVVIVSHDRDFLFTLCDRVLVLDKGLVVADARPLDYICQPQSLRAAQILGTHGWVCRRNSRTGESSSKTYLVPPDGVAHGDLNSEISQPILVTVKWEGGLFRGDQRLVRLRVVGDEYSGVLFVPEDLGISREGNSNTSRSVYVNLNRCSAIET